MTILFIEDEIRGNDFLVEMLIEDYDYEVLWAYSPKEALNMLDEEIERIDVILLDVMMVNDSDKIVSGGNGTRTGVELVKVINEQTQKSIPIVVLSARGALDKVFKGKGQIYRALDKPQKIEAIITALEDALANKSKFY